MHLKLNLSKTKFCITPKLVPCLVVSISINSSSILPLALVNTVESSLTLVFLSHLTFDLVADPVSPAFRVHAGSDYFLPSSPLTCPGSSILRVSFMDHCNRPLQVSLLSFLPIFNLPSMSIFSILKLAKVTLQFKTFHLT